MSAASLLADARAAGLRVTAEGKVMVAGPVPPDLLACLRERKAELAALLTGKACRRCGGPIEDRRPNWLAFADGTAGHVACEDTRDLERRSPEGARVEAGQEAPP